MTEHQPPRIAAAFLSRFLPTAEREFLLGDLEEQFADRASVGLLRAHAWYWIQAIRSAVAFASTRNPQPTHSDHMTNQGFWNAIRLDLKFASRSLRRAPAFATIAILTLAIGIGANAAIFSVVNAVVLQRLPFDESERLMRAYLLMPTPSPNEPPMDMFWSFPKYHTLVEIQDVFEGLGTFNSDDFTFTNTDDAERIVGEVVSASYFTVLRIETMMGRTFVPEEDEPGAQPVAILSYGLWQRRYAAAPDVIGQAIRLNSVSYNIVGVLPPAFTGLSGAAEVFLPASVYAAAMNSPTAHSQNVIARLKPGVTIAQAKNATSVYGRRIDEVYPAPQSVGAWGAHARTLEEVRVEPVIRTSVLLLFGAVGFVLLIACVNLANLLLGRAASRERELAIRLSVGAGRGRIVRQLLTESAVLAFAGGAAGLALAMPTVGFLRRIAPTASGAFAEDVSGLTGLGMDAIQLDGTVLLFTLAVSLVTGALFGLVPALQTSRPSLTKALKEGGGGAPAGRGSRIGTREVLVIAEFALAFVLLVGSGLMIKSFGQLQDIDMGFEPASALSFGLSLPSARYDRETGHRFLETLHERITALPSVDAVGYNICTPLSGGCNGTGITFRDRPASDPGSQSGVEIHLVSPGYFAALGIPIIRGRVFTPRDREGTRGVALISETAAQQFWPNADPIGKMVELGQGDDGDREVVGIVKDVRYDAVDERPFPGVYLPALQSNRRSGFHIVRLSAGDPIAMASTIRELVRSLDPNLPVFDIKTMDERVGDATSSARFSALLLSVYSVIALLLAAIGIYGVLSYAVAQRRQEIGLRIALGAERLTILRLVVGRALVMALVGLGAGLFAAWGLTRILTTILYEVQPNDPKTFGAVAAGLAILAFAASYLPARRASLVDPMIALRRE